MYEDDRQNDRNEFRDPWDMEQPPEQMSIWEPAQYRMAPEPKKRWRAGSIVALVLSCALVLGLSGGLVTGLLMRRAQSELEEPSLEAPTDSGSEQGKTPEAELPEPQDSKPLMVATNNSGVRLAPEEVYSGNVAAVVSIANEATTVNIFGQVSSAASSGSGFLIDASGYIVTNYHVAEGAQRLTVTLTSGESYEAELVGGDADNDVALLKIEGSGFPTCAVGDSDSLRVGEMVAAIGNPLGELTNTLTVGYISALDREINTDGTPINMLQTDAAINAGNSGGPLFDMYGNVVGITTAKYASSTVEGLGFAIPINDAMRIVADLKQYGYVIGRPYLGIIPEDLTVTMASYYNLPVGVYVNGLQEDAAAARAGMQRGDIICAIDGEPCQTQTEMSSLMKKYSAGDTAVLKIYRDGQYLELNVTFDEKPKEEQIQTQQQPTAPQTSGGSSWYPYFGFGFGGR